MSIKMSCRHRRKKIFAQFFLLLIRFVEVIVDLTFSHYAREEKKIN